MTSRTTTYIEGAEVEVKDIMHSESKMSRFMDIDITTGNFTDHSHNVTSIRLLTLEEARTLRDAAQEVLDTFRNAEFEDREKQRAAVRFANSLTKTAMKDDNA